MPTATAAIALSAACLVAFTPTAHAAPGHPAAARTTGQVTTEPRVRTTTVHGKHGRFKFPDTAAAGTGVSCAYRGSRLTSVTIASPLAAGRSYWLRGQYIPWKGKLEALRGTTWTLIATGQGSDSKPIKPNVLTARKPLTIKPNGGLRAGGVYRVVEKLTWIANLPGGPEEGYVKHIVTNYHVGFGDSDRPFCEDARPTVTAPSALSVIGGDTASLDAPGLLADASQAQNDPLRAQLVSLSEGGTPRTGAHVYGDGRFSMPTTDADVGNVITLRYRVIDAAGHASPTVRLTVTVTENPPTAASQSFGPATPGQALNVAPPGLLTGATGTGLTVESVSGESFDPVADSFTWTPDGGFSLTPSTSEDSTTLTFTYTVVDAHGEVSAPATATIPVGHVPPVGNDDPGAGGSYAVTDGHTITECVLANDTFYGGLAQSAVLGTTSFTAVLWRFSIPSTGCFSLTAPGRAPAQTLTFTYEPMDIVAGSPATVTISVTR